MTESGSGMGVLAFVKAGPAHRPITVDIRRRAAIVLDIGARGKIVASPPETGAAMAQTHGIQRLPRSHEPTPAEVDDLLRRAAEHPLGSDFLLDGALDAVAATFQVHAFVVDAARERLGGPDRSPVVHVEPPPIRATSRS
jgi:hypothetical protein